MNRHATLVMLLTAAAVTSAWAQDVECDSSKVLKSVIAVSGNRHAVNEAGDLIGTPAVNTWDLYLLDPYELDASGMLSVWRHLEGTADNGDPASDSAPAISPDGRGRIVFDSNRNRPPGEPLNALELFLMKADGSGQRRLAQGSSASWSPDGKRIAFHRSKSGTGGPIKNDPGAPAVDSVIFVAKVGNLLAGQEAQPITHPIQDDPRTVADEGQVDDDADWSPVGDKIVFTRKNRADADPANPASAEIYVIAEDGTETRLTDNGIEERSPSWSPDGQRIAYSCREGTEGNTLEICVLNADGTHVRLTENAVADLSPHWTPDGRILFQRPVTPTRPGQGQQAWVMEAVRKADGTPPDARQLTSRPGAHMFPAWGEIRVKCGDEDDTDEEN